MTISPRPRRRFRKPKTVEPDLQLDKGIHPVLWIVAGIFVCGLVLLGLTKGFH